MQNPILLFGSPNLSNNEEVRICRATQTLFNVQLISRVLEVQMISIFFSWKAKTISYNFHIGGSNSDARNDILFRQEDKDFHQVKSWPPTPQLVIKSIVSNFGL